MNVESFISRDYSWKITTHLIGVLVLLSAFFWICGIIFQDTRDVLFALAGAGLFISALVYYLIPTRVVPVLLCESIYESFADLGERTTEKDDLQHTHIYIPTDSAEERSTNVALFIPQASWQHVPNQLPSYSNVTVDDDFKGISIVPTGSRMYENLNQILVSPVDTSSTMFVDQLIEILVNGFDLAEQVESLPDEDDDIRLGIHKPLFGSLSEFDHPIPSFLATGLVIAYDAPIKVAVTRDGSDEYDYLLSFRRIDSVKRDD